MHRKSLCQGKYRQVSATAAGSHAPGSPDSRLVGPAEHNTGTSDKWQKAGANADTDIHPTNGEDSGQASPGS